MPSKRIAPAAEALIDTLRTEEEVLEQLEELYQQQLAALRANDSDELNTLTTQVQDCMATLEDMGQKGTRQARLLGRVLDMEADEPSLSEVIHQLRAKELPTLGERLAQVQTEVAERVQAVNQRRETLQLALKYATELNHELLVTMKEAEAEANGQTYTADGQSRQPSGPASDDRSFVNTVG